MTSHRTGALDSASHRRQGTQRASFDDCLSALRRHPPPSVDIPTTPASATFNGSKASFRRSITLLTNFSDFATLIRSTGRKSSRLQQADITTTEFFSESAGQPILEPTVRPSTATMHSARHQQKPESRLYSFLTRSRSRSRSKHQPQDDGPPVTVPGSKPASRIPSRPLSSTTTATNTTITPKPRKQRTPPPDPHPSSASSSRPATPKPSGTRQKLHDLFGIPLRKASRSRSRSRPSSPVGHPVRASLDVPPLPTAAMHDDDTTPRPRKSYAPQISRPRSPSPSLTQKVLRVTNATTAENSTGSTAASIKISKFFTKASTHDAQRPSTAPASVGPPTLPPIPSIVSGPIRHASSLHRRSLIPDQPSQTSLHAPTPPPKITHTPPTPHKSATSNSTVSASTSGSSSKATTTSTSNTSAAQAPLSAPRTGFGHTTKGSLDSNYRYRGGAPMSVLNEEGPISSSPPPRAASSSAHGHSYTHPPSKGKAREQQTSGTGGGIAPAEVGQPVPRPGAVKMSSSVRSTKHGSFDFERPGGWNGIIGIQRSGSGGTTGTSASGVSRRSGVEASREGGKERESVYGPGLAGVGTLQREMSMKRAQEREELLRAKERAKKAGGSAEKTRVKEKEKDRTRVSTSQRTTPDTVHASTSTGASGIAGGTTPNGNGKSSSMGRATGRRAAASLLPKRLTAQHGPFAFEPAVPSPTRSTGTASTCTAHEVQNLPAAYTAERAEKERARVREEKERARSGMFGGKQRRSGAQVAVPVPSVGGVPPTYSSLHPAPPSSIGDSPVPVSMVPRTLSAMLETSPPPHPHPSLTTGNGANGKIGSKAPLPPRPSAGHRSGTKGRSLDLGLGLAWAPSKVREEALLPRSAFFARSSSNGSSAAGRSGVSRTASGASGASGVGVGRSASVRVGGIKPGAGGGGVATEEMSEWDAERAKLGREVAEVFRSVLDKEGYRLFKSYVHQFDAHEIPLDGATGIIARVEKLLVSAPQLGEDGKRRLLDKFMRIILQVA